MIGDRALAVSAAFNTQSARDDWGSLCDPQLAFRCPALARLLALWREKAGHELVPARRNFSLRCLKAILPDAAIYERTFTPAGDARYRVRLMGTAFARTMGDLTGKFLDDAIPTSFLPRWHAALDAAFDANAPLRFVARSHTADKSFLMAEYFEAPLLDDGGVATLVLAASHFGATDLWTQQLAAEHADSLAARLCVPA